MDDIEVRALERALGRLEGKMDLLLANMNTHLLEDTARFKLVDDRVARVERKLFTFAGAVAAVVLIIQAGIAFIKG